MVGMEIVRPASLRMPKAAESDRSFEAFYDQHRVAACRLAWLLTHDASACEDIAQEVFALVYPRFASLDEPTAYPRRVIINRVAERSRRVGRERGRIDLVNAGQPLVSDGPTGGLIDAITVLPLKQRTAVVLRYWADLNHIQIAETMGIRPGNLVIRDATDGFAERVIRERATRHHTSRTQRRDGVAVQVRDRPNLRPSRFREDGTTNQPDRTTLHHARTIQLDIRRILTTQDCNLLTSNFAVSLFR
jgi:DNA-directed RNA polymerase specialized sigma24 family protein